MHTVGSHRVYIHGIHQINNLSEKVCTSFETLKSDVETPPTGLETNYPNAETVPTPETSAKSPIFPLRYPY